MEGGSSKVIVGATMVMAVSLAIVVALVFVLLAELYCSLFLRRRSLRAAAAGDDGSSQPRDTSASRLAPRSLLFPPVAGKHDRAETEDQEPNTINSSVGGVTGAPPAAGHLVYISNPVFDAGVEDTPFETPATSPSRLESGSPSGRYPMTPPLTPMKKLPEKACSVSLGDIANSKMGVSSPSSSTSPSTSPSW